MKRILLTGLLAGVFSLSAFAALKEGDNAPDFSAQASLNGKAFTFSLQSALKKGPVVVYFYPSAYTGGCNIQAHTFAVNQDKFAAAGVTISTPSLLRRRPVGGLRLAPGPDLVGDSDCPLAC